MRKISSLVIFLFLAGTAYCQSPGYLGRKFSVNYDFYFINAMSNPNTGGNTGFFSFTTAHCIAPEYVVGRRVALGLSARYSQTGYFYKSDLEYDGPVALNSYYRNYTLQACNRKTTGGTLSGTMKVITAGFYPKLYLKGAIAPLGSYFKPEVVVNFTTVEAASPKKVEDYLNHDHYYNSEKVPSPDIKNFSPYISLGVGMEFGESRILFNRLILDYGLRMGLTFGSFMMTNQALTESNYFEVVSGRRLFQASLLNLKVGVGLLAF